MTSRYDMPGSSVRRTHQMPAFVPDADDDVLSGPAPATDDTPTTISRNAAPAPPKAEDNAGIRGRRLAHFELIEPIGVGGMAAVIRARDTQLDRFVALKILPPDMAVDPENVKRFHQEARSAAKLDHENIARVFFCGEDQRLHFIAFEFVEGDNLRAVIERRGRLPAGEAIHYMLQVAAGLAHASRRGVVHRDIKPSNIIVTPAGRAKLVDMGLARSLEPRTRENDLTQSGVTLGTFDYISPEQALEPRDADTRSDIYSLGCTFYHALTGRPPVPDGTAAKKLHHHQHVKPVDPRQFVPDLPAEIVGIVDRMIAKNPRDRYATAEELVHRLLLAARKLGASPEVPEGVLAVEAALPNPPGNRLLLWAVPAVLAILGLVTFLDPSAADPNQPPSALRPLRKDDDLGEAKASGTVKPPIDDGGAKAPPDKAGTARWAAGKALNAADLVKWLDENKDAPAIEVVVPGGDIDVSEVTKGEGLRFRAKKKVVLRCTGKTPLVVRLNQDSEWTADAFTAVSVVAPESEVENVRFVVDAHQASREFAALRLSAGDHKVRRCEFRQVRAALDRQAERCTSILADAGTAKGTLAVTDSVFVGFRGGDGGETASPELGGADAIARRGKFAVSAADCYFGPHLAAFRLSGGSNDDELRVQRSTVVLPPRASAAVEYDAGAEGKAVVANSLFARWPGEGDSPAVLVRRPDDALSWQGEDNAFFDLDGYAAAGDSLKASGWKDFRERADKSSAVLPYAPWKARTADALASALRKGDFAAAAAVDYRLPALNGRAGPGKTLGAATVLGVSVVPAAVPEPEKDGVTGRLLVVDGVTDDSNNLHYKGLDEAVTAARPRDTIVVRYNGELACNRLSLDKSASQDLTIRAARLFRPVLTLGGTNDRDAALFRVYDGSLTLEGLEIRLGPPAASAGEVKFSSLSVFAVVGDARTALVDCVVTLGGTRSDDGVPFALARVEGTGRVMKLSDMTPARSAKDGPLVSLERCLVRGDGDLAAVRVNRPFEVSLANSVAALTGSVLSLETTEKLTPPEDGKAKLNLNAATTYTAGPLVRVAVEKDADALIKVECAVTGSLMLPAAAGKSVLVQLSAPDARDRETLAGDKFGWTAGTSRNGYGSFTSLLTRTGGMEMPAGTKVEAWKSMSGDADSRFDLKPEKPPTGKMAEVEPAMLRLPAAVELPHPGATLTKGARPR